MNDLIGGGNSSGGPVECLGHKFPDDRARREFFTRLLQQHLKDSAFRAKAGFPVGSDEAILALSDPPYYTACPNPFIDEFIRHYSRASGDDVSVVEPFASDVSEGRHTWLYKAHAYHTKVPPKAVQKYIEHYTKPGDIVLDAFCGSGMSSLAAAMAQPPRSIITADLSPAASFISFGHSRTLDPYAVLKAGEELCAQLDRELGWMYTVEDESGHKSIANYFVWTDVFLCHSCQGDIAFYQAAFDPSDESFADTFSCPHCGAENSKAKSERATTSHFDHLLGTPWEHYRQDLAVVSISKGGRKQQRRAANQSDTQLINKVLATPPSHGALRLASQMLGRSDQWGDQWKNCMHLRPVTHAHQLLFPGQLRYIGRFLELIDQNDPAHQGVLFVASSVLLKCSRLMRYMSDGIGRIQNGVLYIASCSQEMRFTHMMRIALQDIQRSVHEGLWQDLPMKRERAGAGFLVSTSSATEIPAPDNSIDYIFVDPPFGGNIPYSEVNFLWESLLSVFTSTKAEAVSSPIQGKGIREYQVLMRDSFVELYRVLKPGKWMTVEFSNTKASVWNAIQTSLQEAGFVVANVSALDKKQGSFKAVTTTTAVKQDLVISAYKPAADLEKRFSQGDAGSTSVWDFVRSHLGYLPSVIVRDGQMEYISERDPRIIFDRVVSWLIRHDVPVPLSAQEFQDELSAMFTLRDGMVFLPDQAAEYDKKRAQMPVHLQRDLFVSDERSAIDWLAEALRQKPSTYQELHPEFMSQLGAGWKKHEKRPELDALLENNFLRYDGTGEVPSQIHTYLSSNYREFRGLEKSDPALRAKAQDRWFVPDPNKAQDLEKKREKALLKEFDGYVAATGRKLKEFRLEVLRAGFKTAWAGRDYQTIIKVAQKIPEEALQEDEKLLLWYDQALTRVDAAS